MGEVEGGGNSCVVAPAQRFIHSIEYAVFSLIRDSQTRKYLGIGGEDAPSSGNAFTQC